MDLLYVDVFEGRKDFEVREFGGFVGVCRAVCLVDDVGLKVVWREELGGV